MWLSTLPDTRQLFIFLFERSLTESKFQSVPVNEKAACCSECCVFSTVSKQPKTKPHLYCNIFLRVYNFNGLDFSPICKCQTCFLLPPNFVVNHYYLLVIYLFCLKISLVKIRRFGQICKMRPGLCPSLHHSFMVS